MSANHASNPLIAKFSLLYGLPSKDPVHATAVLAEYARFTANASVNELAHVADRVIAKHKFNSWPKIAEVLEALHDHRQAVHDRNAPERSTNNAPKHPEWTAERKIQADMIIDCELGRKAAREGWAGPLHSFVREHRRLPVFGTELGELRDSARFIRDAAENGVQLGSGPLGKQMEAAGLSQAFRNLAQSFLEKEAAIAAKVLKKDAA